MSKRKKQYLVQLLDDIPDLDPSIVKKAEENDSFTQLDIGEAYCLQTNLPGNYEKAFYWLNLAGKQRNMRAQFLLGDLYALSKGTEKDEFTAYQWYMKSAIQGYPEALTRLHNLYHTEKNIYCRGQRNSEEEKWTQPEFKEENKIRELFEYRVEQMMCELTKTEEYFTELLHECRKQNTVNAHLTLGFLYQHGYGIRKITSRAIEFYTLAAEEGNADAQYNLATIYHAHHNMKWNYREALKWYTEAAENGSIHAQSGLAFLYQHGLGVDTDYTMAIDLYTQAAEMRNVKAQISLGCIFRKGEIVNQDFVKAAEWYKRATKEGSQVAQNCLDLFDSNDSTPTNGETNQLPEGEPPKRYSKKGLCSRLRDDVDAITEPVTLEALKKLASNALKKDGNAMLEIGLNYYSGNQFKQDKNTAFSWIRNAAKTELTKAQCLIAEMYKNGDCVEQDYLKSSIWYARAAKNGDCAAQYQLGQLYYQGLGVRKDPLEASRCYTLAAEKKDIDAQYQLGFLREKGEGLCQDTSEAIEIYTDLAKKKYLEAIYRLGIIHESGNGVEPNLQQALLLYTRIANLNFLNAQVKLGQLYSYPSGEVLSVKTALEYYKIAADQNHPEAKYRLAMMYLDGSGVEQDYIKAYELFMESCELHYENAENIFQIPIDYNKNSDIDYDKVINMFKLVCKHNLSSLEYNIGYIYEHDFRYTYNVPWYDGNIAFQKAKIWYDEAASKDNPNAQYRLGLMYETGKGVARDWVKALGYHKAARKNGNSDATNRLALMYLHGNSISQNFQKAFDLYTEATNQGPSEVVDLLFKSHETTDDEKHLSTQIMLEEMAKTGNVFVQYRLGLLHVKNGSSDRHDIGEGIQWLSKASNSGYIEASYQLGVLYEEGIRVTRNYEEAVTFYQLAADKGHEGALYRLAQSHHYGNGVKRNYIKAFGLYTTAASYGHQVARLAVKITSILKWQRAKDDLRNSPDNFFLDYDTCLKMWEDTANIEPPGLLYRLGKAYEEMESNFNLIHAKKWYSKATNYSHGPSLFRLGRLFELGLGVNKDYKAVINLYNQSAMAGNNDALYALGNIYQQGSGVTLNPSKAFSHYKNAAENGHTVAQFILGALIENRRNFIDAFRWFSIAASQGSENAHTHLENNYENKNYSGRFNAKVFQYLSKLIEMEENTYIPETSFFGEVYYRLGLMCYCGDGTSINYEKAWQYFKASRDRYVESKATTFLNIGFEDLNPSMKPIYLKKLEMWESVVNHLKKEDVYELGIVYYYGVYEDSGDSESEQVYVIVESNTCKSSGYFKTVIDKELPDDNQYYGYSSYYLGMIHYVDTKRKQDKEKALYYFYHALLGGYPTVSSLLKSINRNDNSDIYKKAMYWHQENQSSKEPRITYNIGYMCSEGLGVKKDYKKALKYYEITAGKRHSDSQFALGYMYYYGYGTGKDIDAAIKWFKKAAGQKNAYANTLLGERYFFGEDVKIDYNKALKYFKAAGDQRNSNAQYNVGAMHEYGNGIGINMISAVYWYKKAADQNHIDANFALGRICFEGSGIEKNETKAFEYFIFAAEQGHIESQAMLGYMYKNGLGIEKDTISSIHWYKKAVAQNNTHAATMLGTIYFIGENNERDYSKALEYLKIAADQGSSDAQRLLGYMYENGCGTKRDMMEAIHWYEKGAAQNNIEASNSLGGVYFLGRGIKKNYAEAFRYYKIAASKGHIMSRLMLGFFYLNGHGCDKDEDKGAELLEEISSDDDFALVALGQLYHATDPKNQNFLKALEYYQKVPEGIQRSFAFRGIGLLYEHGDGVKQNYQEALAYYQMAATEQSQGAYYNIALLYYYGNGVDKDYATSFRWFTKIIEDIIYGAAYICVLDESRDESETKSESQKVYSIESELFFYGETHWYLGMMCQHGQGTTIDKEKAAEHFKMAIYYGCVKTQ